MSIIRFNSQQADPIRQFLDTLPDIDLMDVPSLRHYLAETQNTIQALDALEPRSETSEAYEQWADLHEELEDVLDEILDCLEDGETP